LKGHPVNKDSQYIFYGLRIAYSTDWSSQRFLYRIFWGLWLQWQNGYFLVFLPLHNLTYTTNEKAQSIHLFRFAFFSSQRLLM
jgi:hypothetical protein